MNKPKIAISVGDPSGIGPEIALLAHNEIKNLCQPIYFINHKLLDLICKKLEITKPDDFELFETKGDFALETNKSTRNSGRFSFHSFKDAIKQTISGETSAVVTLPINKESWKKADINYKGHTEVLRDYFKSDAIMMLGCNKLFVALFTEHIALKKVSKLITKKRLRDFLLDFYNSVQIENIGVLGLNPHAGENGVLGDEEIKISKAIKEANEILGKKIFNGPLVPDVAFTPHMREKYQYFVAMHHDQGLGPLKALFFEESINVSLNLPIIRTSVDHGTAFDIAYKKDRKLNLSSYINAVKEAVRLSQNKL